MIEKINIKSIDRGIGFPYAAVDLLQNYAYTPSTKRRTRQAAS